MHFALLTFVFSTVFIIFTSYPLSSHLDFIQFFFVIQIFILEYCCFSIMF